MSEMTTLPVARLHLSEVHPRQSLPDLDDMVDTVVAQGLLAPLLVRQEGGGYGVLAGSRRLAAARQLGLEEVPVVIMLMDDRTAAIVAMADNTASRNLAPMETARGYAALHDDDMTYEEIALSCGVAKNTVYRYVRLLDLGEDDQELVSLGELSKRDALAKLQSPDDCPTPPPGGTGHGPKEIEPGSLGAATNGDGPSDDDGRAGAREPLDPPPDSGPVSSLRRCPSCDAALVAADRELVSLPAPLVEEVDRLSGASDPLRRSEWVAELLQRVVDSLERA